MTAFSYRLVRSRRRTLALMITRLGELEVRAPLGLPQADIDRFVEQKQDWITSRLRERERVSLPAFRWGDTVPFLGREAPVWSGEASAFDGGRFFLAAGGTGGGLAGGAESSGASIPAGGEDASHTVDGTGGPAVPGWNGGQTPPVLHHRGQNPLGLLLRPQYPQFQLAAAGGGGRRGAVCGDP